MYITYYNQITITIPYEYLSKNCNENVPYLYYQTCIHDYLPLI